MMGKPQIEAKLENIAYYLSALQASLFFNLLETTVPENATQKIITLAKFFDRGISLDQ
jgi:hypothetical protein